MMMMMMMMMHSLLENNVKTYIQVVDYKLINARLCLNKTMKAAKGKEKKKGW
jgi:hypothetical protein